MRKRILWFVASLSLLAPGAALTVRWTEARNGSRLLAQGAAALEVPVESGRELAAADALRAQGLLEQARRSGGGAAVAGRARALWHAAQAYVDLSRGELTLARNETDTAERLAPGEPHALLAAATTLARQGDRAGAERALARLLDGSGSGSGSERVPSAVAARAGLLRVEVLLDAGRAHDALDAAEALDREHPRAACAKNLLGLARGAAGDREGAREAFERAAELDPRAAAPRVNLARLAREGGDLGAAREALERALAVEPESAEAWLAYGVVLADLRDPAARHALVHAGTLAPDDAEPYVAQGELDLADGNLSGAVESFRLALAREADEPTAQTNLGIALARQGDRAAAEQAFERATRVAPHQGEAWNGLGAMRLAAGDAGGALGALQQASVLLPADPNPVMNLGRAFEALERWDEAARAYREVLRRAPGHTAALGHLARIAPGQVPAQFRAPAHARAGRSGRGAA